LSKLLLRSLHSVGEPQTFFIAFRHGVRRHNLYTHSEPLGARFVAVNVEGAEVKLLFTF
jgi:hypothetical protein